MKKNRATKTENMNMIQKKILLCLIYASFVFTLTGFAEDKKENTDWDKRDEKLFFSLVQEQRADNAGAYESLGRYHFQGGRYDRADFYFKKALGLNPNLYLSWFYLGLVHIDSPEEYLKNAIKCNSKFAPSYYWLASFYCKDDRTGDAIQYFKKYITAAGNEPVEKDRVETAKDFIRELKKGEKGYNRIAEKVLAEEKQPKHAK
jgi:tetratricopeptide (TPR) repeat protein